MSAPALLWKIDGPIAQAVAKAKKRFDQRPELSGQTPTVIIFHPGQAPANGLDNGLKVSEAIHVPEKHFKLV